MVVDADLTPVFACITLELPDRQNQTSISQIKADVYKGKKYLSKTFGWCIAIEDKHGRKYVRIHPANWVEQLRGCVAVGKFLMDVDGDGDADDINSSKNTMTDILNCLPYEFTVTVKDPA